jgi:hypothetical protein
MALNKGACFFVLSVPPAVMDDVQKRSEFVIGHIVQEMMV